MKRKSGLLFALALTGVIGTAGAQTADEIVSKHIKAIGGDAWKKVTSFKTTAKLSAQGQVMTVTQIVMPGQGMRQDMDLGGGMKGYTIITPKAGWSFMPMGGDKAVEMSPEEVAAGQGELLVGDAIYNAKAKGEQVALLGKEELDGKPAFKLGLVDKESDTTFTWVDATDFHIVRSDEEQEMQGQKFTVSTHYADYKKLPEGIVVAGSLKQSAMGQEVASGVFENYEINKQKDASVFKPE